MMGSQYKWISASPEEIINVINDPIGKKFADSLFTAFLSNGLTYKTRPAWFPKSSADWGYTVHFYIKKGKEAIIMNATTQNFGGIQLRINDWSTFDKLDDYNESIRKAILIDSIPSENEHDDGSYIFTYHGKEYRLRYQLSANFRFHIHTNDDIDCLIDIINREISFGKPNRK